MLMNFTKLPIKYFANNEYVCLKSFVKFEISFAHMTIINSHITHLGPRGGLNYFDFGKF